MATAIILGSSAYAAVALLVSRRLTAARRREGTPVRDVALFR
jgi:hypothetical protein